MTRHRRKNSMLEPLKVFATEVFVGTVIFITVAIPAIGLNFSIKWLEKSDIDFIIVKGLSGLEYFLFAVDVSLFAFYIVKSAIKVVKEL